MDNLIFVLEHNENSYKVITEFETWKTAIMNDMERFRSENIEYMQKHTLSDEIFVLLSGNCVLFVATGDEKPEELIAVPMEHYKVYNIKKGVWHTHTFAKNTKVFIVENSNTCDENSPKYFNLTKEQKSYVVQFSKENNIE